MRDEQDDPTLSLITDPFGPAPGPRPGESGLLPSPRVPSLIADDRESERLQDAARRAPATSPDQAARLLWLQRRTGFPVDLIERNADEIERQTAAADFDVERFRAESPLLARWLAEHPTHLALAQDDLRPLSVLEQTLRFGTNALRSTTAELYKGLDLGAWSMFEAAGDVLGLPGVAAFGKRQNEDAAAIARGLRGEQEGAGPVEQAIYSGFGSIGNAAPIVATALLSGGGTAATRLGLGLMGTQAGGAGYSEARAAGVGVGPALGFGVSQGAVEAATEAIPFHRLVGDLAAKTGLFKTLIHQAWPEIAGEEIATALQDLNEWAILHPDRPFSAYVAERPAAAIQTAIATVVATGVQTGAFHTLERVASSVAAEQVLGSLSAAARTSKTIGRAPELVGAFIDRETGDGPLASVDLPIDTFTEYFQSKHIDPAQRAEQLTGDATAFVRAQETGDLTVTMGTYLTVLAAGEHGAFFAQEARLAGAPNVRERAILETELGAQLAAAPTGAASASAGVVRDAVRAQLEQAGFSPQTATVHGSIFESTFQTIGARAGLDPLALFNRYRLLVNRAGLTAPAGPGVTPAADASRPTEVLPTFARREDSPAQQEQRRRSHWGELLAHVLRDARAVDPTVDEQVVRREFAARRARFEEGEAAAGDSARDPQALLRAIADYGGVWWEKNTGAYKGEIEIVKASNTAPDQWAGVKGVFRKAGLTPDGMVEALRQDQRFQWVTDINVLIDAIDTAVRNPEASEALPGSTELKQALGIQLGSAWWPHAPAPAAVLGEDTVFHQGAVDARRAALEERITRARAAGREDVRAVRELQDLRETDVVDAAAAAPPARTTERHDFDLFRQDDRGSIRFTPDRQVTIDLFARSDLSTVLHESAHFYLEVLGDVVDELSARDLATLTDSQRRMLGDFGAVLSWLGVENRADITTDQHEQWARGFEAYLLEGHAPSPELRAVFARVRAWLVGIYRSVRRLQVELTPEVRGVMDRLLASDEAITAAERDLHVVPLFTDAIADAAGLSPADRVALRETMQAASDRARETLDATLLRQLQRERAVWWKDERAAVRAQVARDVAAEPAYRALALLQRGTLPDGSPLPDGTEPFKLSRELLVEEFGAGVLARLPAPRVYTDRTGVAPAVAAELLGFPSSAALVVVLTHTTPIAEAIDAATDEEMVRRHGDMRLDGTITDAARSAVLEAGADVFAAELKTLAAVATRQPGGRRVSAPLVSTVRELAQRRIADTPLKAIRPAGFAAAARRAGEQALEAAGRHDFRAALAAKQRQVLNAELFRAATAARETIEDAIASFKPMLAGRDAVLAQRYDLNLVNAARALLSQFGLAPPAQTAAAHVYLEQVRRYDPELHADLEAATEAATQPPRPYQELSLNEFIAVRDAVDNLWHTARRSKQIVIDGQARDLGEVAAELGARLEAISTPGERRGYQRQVSRWQQTKLYLLGARAALRRVESWANAVDGADPRGAFTRLLFQPISTAASTYRAAKKTTLERYLSIVKAVESSLTTHAIDARAELGYTFSGKLELLHALLHTGNASNQSKLLRGRNWAGENPDGSRESDRWDAFIRRMWREGVLTKVDYDYVQAVWDLNESLKPDAQRVFRDLYGYFFAEITAVPFETPFGTYRGGYVPAIVDPFIATDAALRGDRAAMEETPNSFMFPSTGRGFTKGRVEPYARPLALDLRHVPAHLDAVLRFIHLQPAVRDAGRLVIHRGFRKTLDTFDPAVGGELLMPWLQRAAKQSLDTPAQGWGGRGMDRFWRGLRRRTGMQIMVANVVNALQQVTGLSVSALKVPPRALGRALWRYVRGPAVLTTLITDKSVFMQTRTLTQTIEVQQHIDDLLLNPSTYEQARAFGAKHGYFLSAATQNIVDVITWSGAYDHAVSEGRTEPEAVQQADAAVRLTQGSFNPEDLSAFETGSPMKRAFTMFYSYFGMLSNTLGSEFAVVMREMGLRQGAGRLLYVYSFGFVIPAVLSELLIQAMSGQPWDEDDDGAVLDDLLGLFFGAQRRTATAMLPGIGPALNIALNGFNDNWYDDRISVSPAVNAIENAGHAPAAVYRAITEGTVRRKDVRDVLTLVGLLTGVPAGAAARPLGYLADVAEGEIEPTGPVDVARGLVTGR